MNLRKNNFWKNNFGGAIEAQNIFEHLLVNLFSPVLMKSKFLGGVDFFCVYSYLVCNSTFVSSHFWKLWITCNIMYNSTSVKLQLGQLVLTCFLTGTFYVCSDMRKPANCTNLVRGNLCEKCVHFVKTAINPKLIIHFLSR